MLNLEIFLDMLINKIKAQTSIAPEAGKCQTEGHGFIGPMTRSRKGVNEPRCRALALVIFD